MVFKDVGYQCDFVAKAKAENEIMGKVSPHAKAANHMKDRDFTLELVVKVKGAMKKE